MQITSKKEIINFKERQSPRGTHLYNSRVTWQPIMWFWLFRHSDVFDVTASEDYIFINFIFWWHWSVCVPVLCPIRFYCWENS